MKESKTSRLIAANIRKTIDFKKKKVLITWLCIAAAIAVILTIALRPKHIDPVYPVVEVEPVTTQDVNIYGE